MAYYFKALVALVIVALLLKANDAHAEWKAGLTWLQAQVQSDGQLAGEERSMALPLQSRSEVVRTLEATASVVPSTLLAAVDRASSAPSVEFLARQVLALKSEGSNSSAKLTVLLAMQNSDGGFGASKGYGSNALDTAWALQALAGELGAVTQAEAAVGWLLSRQNTDGSWPMVTDGDLLYPTAVVADALQRHRGAAGVSAALSKARTWLTGQRNSAQAWENNHESALALLAILPGLSNAAAVQASVDQLSAQQKTNGSWDDDVYTTALAIRALYRASQPYTDPDLATIKGVLVDDATNKPVANASIELLGSGRQVISDEHGAFNIGGVVAGDDQLEIRASGYRKISSLLRIQTAQNIDLGQMRLVVSRGETGFTLKGIVRSQANVNNYYEVEGALVSAGGLSVKTKSGGYYQLDNIPAGQTEVAATFGSYSPVYAMVSAKAGDIVEFNPVFKNIQGSKSTVTVTVTDALTGAPLSGVSVSLKGSALVTASTGSSGSLRFQTGVSNGVNTLALSKAGYEAAVIAFNNSGDNSIEIPVALRPTSSKETALKGVVRDVGTMQPIAGADVVLDNGAAYFAKTNSLGEYQFSGAALAGARTIKISADAYSPVVQSFQISSGFTTVFDVALRKNHPAMGAASLEVKIADRSTALPIAGGSIQLSGTNSFKAQTNDLGSALIQNLNPGETQILIAAPGYESLSVSSVVQAGQQYVLPVDLAPDSGLGAMRLYGQVVDSATQAPISGATVTVSGAWSGMVTTGSNGGYSIPGLQAGTVEIRVVKANYIHFVRKLELVRTTEASIPMVPSWLANSAWSVNGTVLDATSLEPLAGVNIVLEEVIPGAAVTAMQSLSTGNSGAFSASSLYQQNARIFLTMDGYDSMAVPFAREASDLVSLGVIRLKRSYNSALPDIQLKSGDRTALVVDPNTFKATGVLSAEVFNNSIYSAGAFDVSAFVDVNGNEQFDHGLDIVIGTVRVNGLNGDDKRTIKFDIRNVALPFRDAPVYIVADSGLEVVENIEENNTRRISLTCANGVGGIQDIGVCVDTSSSVGGFYDVEMQGVIKAIENPNIIPHDGSIRFMLGTDNEMYYGSGIPLNPAVVVTPSSLPQLLSDLKSKRKSGGYSSGPTCVRRMSEYMLSLPGAVNKRTVITVGDGYWEGIPKAVSELVKTVANGVSRVDVIGVGSVNLPELEANAWPKPVNSAHGGKVTIAYSAADIAAAMAQTIGSAAQNVDLTLGNFRIIDQGENQPVKLSARVGSSATASQQSTVRFYQGSVLLAELVVPALKAGEWVDVSADKITLVGTDTLTAVVDEGKANAECNTSNNRQQIPLLASNALAAIQVATDLPTYSATAPVALSGTVTNLGRFAADLGYVLSVEDSQGEEIVSFAQMPLGTVAAGASVPVSQGWNTGNYLAGTYALRGRVFDTAGDVVAEHKALFAITATGNLGPVAALTVGTDKGTYTANDAVQISNVISNLASNGLFDQGSVQLSVLDPGGQTVFSYTHAIGQLVPNVVLTRQANQLLKGATLGWYTVKAELFGLPQTKSGSVGAKFTPASLATASTTYQVVAGGRTGSVQGLTGSVALAQASLKAGDAQTRDDLVRNTGSTAFSQLKVWRVLVNAADGSELQRHEESLDLPTGTQKTWVATPISTVALLKGTYLALLMAELQGQTVLLDQKSFVITESATTVDPGTIGLAGSVAIAAPSVKAGEAQSRDDRVRNTGSTNISQLKVQRVVLNLATNAEVQRLEDTVDLAIGAQKSWLGTPISTAALAKGNYQVLLLAQVQGQLLQLDQKTFVVTEAGTPVVPGNTAKPIPSLGTAGLLALALAMAASGACLARQRPRHTGKQNTTGPVAGRTE